MAADGSLIWQGKVGSEPGPLIDKLIPWRDEIDTVGLEEACPLSEWLHRHLTEAGFNAVCVEVGHAQRFRFTRPVKTDRNDARGLAEMMRVGHYRAVHVKAPEAQDIRTTPLCPTASWTAGQVSPSRSCGRPIR